MKLKTPFLLLLFIAFSLSMQAQQKLVLDLGAARKYALEYNKNMKNADYATDKAQYALREAIANGLPQLNATMDYSNAL
ncbi:MAG: TolC family protein, partial [Bacteroidales bacterium]|nr:TolC family protein [Bacteroidales bacterium]